ncbi:ABC transporter G family member 7 [Astathelohania contejeani]|uniref:ABC transporter G family member 7 n=1 Tax=Astathelohania contejeani TaxID=164912 RepID=A0ABQ7HZP7_9MICR|nr:ABC transporter G family member 7 [Thelohania contejeani]
MKSIIEFRNITYKVKKRFILKNINGVIRINKCMLIMGPSGCGKTSLLKIISGRNLQSFEGSVQWNIGEEKLEDISGYIHQDDIFDSNMTVEENIKYSGDLRSGKCCVDNVMSKLSLHQVKHRTIQENSNLKISGGEAKRVAIAMELIRDPDILFLDEPTSGLDSYNALKLVTYLKELSEYKTIVATIHQPSADIFFSFDDVLLIGTESRLVYQGETSNIIEVLFKEGVIIPLYCNPIDYILQSEIMKISKTIIYYKKNTCHGVEPIRRRRISNLRKKKITISNQILIIMKKEVIALSRNKFSLILIFFQSFILSFFIGIIFYNIPSKPLFIQYKNTIGFLGFLSMTVLFSPSFSTINNFQKNLPLVKRQVQAKYYNVISYMAVRLIIESVINTLQPIIIAMVTYLLVLYPMYSSIQFMKFLCLTILTQHIGLSLGFLISSCCPNLNLALFVAPSFLLLLIITNGLMIDPYLLLEPFKTLQYISPARHTFNGYVKIHFSNQSIFDVNIYNLVNRFLSIGQSFLVLGMIYIICISFTFIVLFKKLKM